MIHACRDACFDWSGVVKNRAVNHAVMAAAVAAVLGGLAGCASAPVSYHTLQVPAVPGQGTGAQPDLRYQIAAVNLPERLNRVDMVLSGAPGKAGGAADAKAGRVSGAASPGSSGQQAGGAPGEAGAGADGSVAQVVADTRVTVLETERWDASLSDVLRDALSQQLAVAAARPAEGGALPAPARLRLTLQVYRFDGSARGDVDVLVDWRLRRLDVPDEALDGGAPSGRDGVAGGDGAEGRDRAEDGAESGKRAHRGADALVLDCRYQGQARVPAGEVPAMVSALQQQVAGLASDIVASSRAWLRGSGHACGQAPR